MKSITHLLAFALGLALYAITAHSARQQEPLHLEQAIGNNPYIILLEYPYNSPEMQGYCYTDDNCMDVMSVHDVMPERTR